MTGEAGKRAYWDSHAADYAEHAQRSAYNALTTGPRCWILSAT